MKSCRSGFIRCNTREGPIGSHQLLARAEKWESSSAETDDVECGRDDVRKEDDGLHACGRKERTERRDVVADPRARIVDISNERSDGDVIPSQLKVLVKSNSS